MKFISTLTTITSLTFTFFSFGLMKSTISSSNAVDVKQLAAGIYFIKVYQNGKEVLLKLIKQ